MWLRKLVGDVIPIDVAEAVIEYAAAAAIINSAESDRSAEIVHHRVNVGRRSSRSGGNDGSRTRIAGSYRMHHEGDGERESATKVRGCCPMFWSHPLVENHWPRSSPSHEGPD